MMAAGFHVRLLPLLLTFLLPLSGHVAADEADTQQRIQELEQRIREMEQVQQAEQARDRKARVDTLLRRAEAAFATMRHNPSTAPDPDPVTLYREVLALDAKNLEADVGLDQVVRWHLDDAGAAEKQGKLKRAQASLANAAAIRPDNNTIARRQAAIETALAARVSTKKTQQEQQKQKIAGLLASANTAFEALQLTTPRESSALHYYRKVLALEAGNTAAREGIARIANRYIAFAEAAMKRGELQKTGGHLDKAAALAPDDGRIETLRAALRNAQAEAAATVSVTPKPPPKTVAPQRAGARPVVLAGFIDVTRGDLELDLTRTISHTIRVVKSLLTTNGVPLSNIPPGAPRAAAGAAPALLKTISANNTLLYIGFVIDQVAQDEVIETLSVECHAPGQGLLWQEKVERPSEEPQQDSAFETVELIKQKLTQRLGAPCLGG